MKERIVSFSKLIQAVRAIESKKSNQNAYQKDTMKNRH